MGYKSEVTFEPYQKVLVRDYEEGKWTCSFFSHIHKYKDGKIEFICINEAAWDCCLPYNDETAHLLGTADSPTPPEPEFKWGDHVEVRNDKYNDWKKALFCNRNGGLNMCLAIGDSVVTGWRRCRHADW